MRLHDKKVNVPLDAYKIVEDYQHLHRIKTVREALAALLNENLHTRMYLQYFLDHRNAEQADPACLRRIVYAGAYYCCRRAPKITELPTLDICVACKWNLVVKTYVSPLEEPPSVSAGNTKTQETIEAPEKVWCPSVGFKVLIDSCRTCNAINCGHNPKKHIQKF